jgi:hypothetical protein
MGITKDGQNEITRVITNHLLSSEMEHRAVLLGRPTMIDSPELSPEFFFTQLGFVDVQSLDVHDGEGASIIHDMNHPLPERHSSAFDFVFDNGTMEHCFNPCQFMLNIHELLRPNGIIFHTNPIYNYINHGFFSFSPCFYLAFYLENNYELLEMSFFGTKKEFLSNGGSRYENVFTRRLSGETLLPLVKSPRIILKSAGDPKTMVTIGVVARKKQARAPKIPQQPIYSQTLSAIPPSSIISL